MNRNSKRTVVIGRKSFVTPFSLTLVNDGGQMVECTKLLRIVPGKRAVLLGRWCLQPVVVKLFYKRFKIRKHVNAEIKGNRHLRAAGIRTAKILYSGPVTGSHAKALVFEALLPSKELGSMASSELDASQRIVYFEMLMAMIARMHENGLIHNDLHLGNFLIKNGALYAVDAASLRKKARKGKLSREASLNNLAVLFAQPDFNVKGRFRELVSIYCKTRDIACSDELLAELKQRITRSQRIRMQKYLKKKYRASTETVCQKTWNSFALCKRTFYTPAMADFLEHPDVAFEPSKSTMLMRGDTVSVAKVRVDDRVFVVKRYDVKHPFHLRGLYGIKSWAKRFWFNGHKFMAHDISTPAPIALKKIGFGPLKRRAWLICEHIEGISVRDYVQACLPADQDDISKQILDIFNRLQTLRISHSDIQGTNMIVHQGKVYLINLDKIVAHKNMTKFKSASRKDVERFIKKLLSENTDHGQH